MPEGQNCQNCVHFDDIWWFLHYFAWESPKLVHFGHIQKFALFGETWLFLVEMDAEWLWIGWKQFIRTFSWCFSSLFRQKGYNTWCSQAVSHPSTNQALRCLTSVIGREPVHSTWYGRSHWQLKQNWFCIWQHSFIQLCFTHLAIFFHFFRGILMKIFLQIT